MGRLFPFAKVVLVLLLLASPAAAAETHWTAIISGSFAGNVYFWSLASGGGYQEEGRLGMNGPHIQSTLTGHWSRRDAHLVLHQDSIPYVFDGTVEGTRYSGTLYLGGRPISQFCAAAGTSPPKNCDAPSV